MLPSLKKSRKYLRKRNEAGLEADLWRGSSACRAEPVESSSVGTPEQKDNLQTQRKRSGKLDHFDIEWNADLQDWCHNQSYTLTKVGFIGTTLQTDTFGAGLNQEVPHQLISHVTNWKRYSDKWNANTEDQFFLRKSDSVF